MGTQYPRDPLYRIIHTRTLCVLILYSEASSTFHYHCETIYRTAIIQCMACSTLVVSLKHRTWRANMYTIFPQIFRKSMLPIKFFQCSILYTNTIYILQYSSQFELGIQAAAIQSSYNTLYRLLYSWNPSIISRRII